MHCFISSLLGFLKPPHDGSAFDYVWTDDESQDEQGWLQFLALMEQYREQYPDLILCHFSSYEVVNIKRYAKRYDMEEHPTVQWLLGDDSPLFDIQPVVKNIVAGNDATITATGDVTNPRNG